MSDAQGINPDTIPLSEENKALGDYIIKIAKEKYHTDDVKLRLEQIKDKSNAISYRPRLEILGKSILGKWPDSDEGTALRDLQFEVQHKKDLTDQIEALIKRTLFDIMDIRILQHKVANEESYLARAYLVPKNGKPGISIEERPIILGSRKQCYENLKERLEEEAQEGKRLDRTTEQFFDC